MNPQDLSIFLTGKDLDHTVRMAGNKTATVSAGREPADFVGNAQLFGLFLCIADTGKLRPDISTDRAFFGTECSVPAHSVFSSHVTHSHGSVGKHILSRAVADGIDTRNICFHAFVGCDKPFFRMNAGSIQIQAGCFRAAPDSEQHFFCLYRLFTIRAPEGNLCSVPDVFHLCDSGIRIDFHALPDQLCLYQIRQFRVHSGQKLRLHFHYSDLCAVTEINAAQFQPDYSSTDHEKALRDMIQREACC